MKPDMFTGLDHIAIVVPDTEEALRIWRDRVGLQVVHSEIVNGGTVRLTHLDLGNAHLQLVEPLVSDHPLKAWLEKHGPGLHHLCMEVENVDRAMSDASARGIGSAAAAHQGIKGKRALFLKRDDTQGVQVEVTGL